MRSVAAIDLGATSGRVIVGAVEGGELRLRHVARFPNTPVRLADGLHWDVLSLYSAAMQGLGRASREDDELVGAAIDSWAVDYGLLHGARLLGNPFHYRDARNEAAVTRVHAVVGPEELFRRNGLQHLPFNTVFQLAAAAAAGELDEAEQLLLVPDLLGYWATGSRVAERTNASTTGLLRVGGDWDVELLPRLALRRSLLPPVVDPGTDLGPVLPEVAAEFGIADRIRFSTVGSHDTASAVVGVPMADDGAVYISCGTWSLVGAELPAPVVSDDARAAGFTNEGGVDGRTRFLKNVMGLWLLSESVRAWEKVGEQQELGALLKQAAEAPADVPTFDANDPRLLAPGDMPARIEALLLERGSRVPASVPEFVRGVLQSLANAYADAVREIERLTGRTVRTVHLVGGGAQNALLCQLTADTVGVPVVAGPVEATAIGNLLVQARTHGILSGDLEALRAVTARSFPPRTYAVRPFARG
ncbi:rhamnulokinase [Amnibacterium kyonggiense]|uniref:Rhamnulokinase n=1 Tax=Amnibacterium kyonggiense TaxID=595671 RepID=A0A4R7FIS8_9MICO|nr:rhamnulokinase family protein [Amnibacterium kyonggiense]TDS75048.1 rhamnulokinase [Amnibacterium kyonggiense]